ncbi:MAG: diguanylate cyclase [Planctomycetota bacterium]
MCKPWGDSWHQEQTLPLCASSAGWLIDADQTLPRDLASPALLDPGLLATSVRFANNPMFGTPGSLWDPLEAVSALGERTLRLLGLSALLATAELDDDVLDAVTRCAVRARQRCDRALRVFDRFDAKGARSIAAASALAETGRVLAAVHDPAWRTLQREHPFSLREQEIETFGRSGFALAAHLLRTWRAHDGGAALIESLDEPESPGEERGVAHALWFADRAVERTEPATCGDEMDAGWRDEVRTKAPAIVAELSLGFAHRNRALEREREELTRRVETDELTGVRTRAAFERRLVEEIERARRERKPLAVLLCDLDNFKQINDTYGHLAGDALLTRTAEAMRAAARRMDMVARFGGEEFAVIAANCGVEGAEHLAERLRSVIEELRVGDPDGGTFGTTVSIGVAVFAPVPGDEKHRRQTVSRDELLLSADRALYDSKRAGKNRWMIAELPTAA